MKVLFFIDNLNSGGAQRQIANLASYLYRNNMCEVEIITYYRGNHYVDITTDIGIRVTLIEKKSRFDIFFIYKLLKFVYSNKVDVICAFLFTPSFYTLLVKILSFRKIKVIVSERTFEKKLDVIPKITRVLYKYADTITANSESQAEVLKSKYKNIANKVKCIRNGVDTDLFNSYTENVPDLFSIVAIGRIEPLKNALCLIEALFLLKSKYNIDVHVKWAGNLEKKATSVEYYNECNRKLLEYNLTSNWDWVGVIKNISAFLESSEMLIHPSFGEGFPNVICEALSAQKIVFASNVYDHPLIIEDNFNGFLFDPLRPDILADKISLYLKLDNKSKMDLKNNARFVAVNKFSYKHMAENYYNLFLNE